MPNERQFHPGGEGAKGRALRRRTVLKPRLACNISQASCQRRGGVMSDAKVCFGVDLFGFGGVDVDFWVFSLFCTSFVDCWCKFGALLLFWKKFMEQIWRTWNRAVLPMAGVLLIGILKPMRTLLLFLFFCRFFKFQWAIRLAIYFCHSSCHWVRGRFLFIYFLNFYWRLELFWLLIFFFFSGLGEGEVTSVGFNFRVLSDTLCPIALSLFQCPVKAKALLNTIMQ